MEQAEGDGAAVVMVPFVEYSHLNQLLQLSRLIVSSYPTIPIHYASSSFHIKLAQTRAHGFDPSHMAKIRFHELPMTDFDPSSWADLLRHLREPFADYLREMSRKFRKVIIIHDFLVSTVVQDVVSIGNVESYMFNAVSAFSMVSYTFQEIGQTIPLECSKEPPSLFDDVQAENMREFSALKIEARKYSSGYLINTVRSVEAPFLDMLAREEISKGGKIWSIGPMLPTNPPSWGQETVEYRHECLKWLDKHKPSSVIYVSFGTKTSFSYEQIGELALGLEQSGAKFLWILRDADRGNAFNGDERRIELPRGFEERIEGVGLIARDWAPQVDILAHPSTGGFVSHCGWNSILESLTMGVPLATWPTHADQPGNAYLVTEILKAGIVARDWTQRKELMKASVIAEVVRKLMASEEGDAVRMRARELCAILKQAVEEGGESKAEMDSYIAHITRN